MISKGLWARYFERKNLLPALADSLELDTRFRKVRCKSLDTFLVILWAENISTVNCENYQNKDMLYCKIPEKHLDPNAPDRALILYFPDDSRSLVLINEYKIKIIENYIERVLTHEQQEYYKKYRSSYLDSSRADPAVMRNIRETLARQKKKC